MYRPESGIVPVQVFPHKNSLTNRSSHFLLTMKTRDDSKSNLTYLSSRYLIRSFVVVVFLNLPALKTCFQMWKNSKKSKFCTIWIFPCSHKFNWPKQIAIDAGMMLPVMVVLSKKNNNESINLLPTGIIIMLYIFFCFIFFNFQFKRVFTACSHFVNKIKWHHIWRHKCVIYVSHFDEVASLIQDFPNRSNII